MQTFSTEALSNEYLHVNNCDCQNIDGMDTNCLRPNGRIDYHILYIAEGCCFVTEADKVIEAQAGSVIIYLPGERQEYGFKKEISTKSYYIHFSGTACKELMEKFGMTERRVFYIGYSSRLIELYSSMIDEYHLKLLHHDYICQSILLSILSVIGRKISCTDVLKNKGLEKKMNEICRYIFNNYSKKLSVSECAKICGLSESRFSHLFKKAIGISPTRYILNAKTEIAKKQLSNTALSVLQISRNLGFDDQNYFSRIFKLYTGFSPTEYRKL